VKKFYGDNTTPYTAFLRPDGAGGIIGVRWSMFEAHTDERPPKRTRIPHRTTRNFGGDYCHNRDKLDSLDGGFLT
jgi:hypothetical protein